MDFKGESAGDESFGEVRAAPRPRGVPGPTWIVVFLLGLEGIGNLAAIPYMPQAAGWLAFKCLAIVGLVRGWRWVYMLTLVVAGLHVAGFGMHAAFAAFLNVHAALAAFLNLIIVGLLATSLRRVFPESPPEASPVVLNPQVREASSWEVDA